MSHSRAVLWSGLAFCLLAPLPALAQGAPARNGNVYDGTAHEPVPGVVRQDEKAAGVAPPPAVQQKEDDTVRQIDKQLLGNKDNLSNPQAPRQ